MAKKRRFLPAGSIVQCQQVPPETWLHAIMDRTATVSLPFAGAMNHMKPWNGDRNVTARHLIVYVRRGDFAVTLPDQRLRLGTGMLLWLPPGVERAFGGRFAQTYRLHLEIAHGPDQLAFDQHPLLLRRAAGLLPQIRQLVRLRQTPNSLYPSERLRGLVLTLATGVLQELNDDDGKKSGLEPRVLTQDEREAIDICLLERLSKGITPRDLASAAGLSPDYFARLFRNTYGMAPKTYIKCERLRRVAALLDETNLPLKVICADMDIVDISLLCRQFRSMFGCTPLAYRSQNREAP